VVIDRTLKCSENPWCHRRIHGSTPIHNGETIVIAHVHARLARPFACATGTHNARVRRTGDDVRVNVGTEDLDTPLDSPLDTDLSQV
jgi:hypothetical protein